MTTVRLEPVAPRSRVKHSTFVPLSHRFVFLKSSICSCIFQFACVCLVLFTCTLTADGHRFKGPSGCYYNLRSCKAKVSCQVSFLIIWPDFLLVDI